jgi:hypothetical protein
LKRPLAIALGALGVVLFLAISLFLARALGVPGVERGAVVDTVKVQARLLHKPGTVRILNLKPETTIAIRSETRVVRVAWEAGNALPVVQCATVRRDGDVIGGFDVHVVKISRPIPRDADCTRNGRAVIELAPPQLGGG